MLARTRRAKCNVDATSPANRIPFVPQGIIKQDLKDHLRPFRLSYPPDPGTLGIVVEATIRLIPLISDTVTAVAVFPDEPSGLQTVADFMAAGGQPSLFELLDRASIHMLNAYGDFGLDADAGSMLLVQFDRLDAVRASTGLTIAVVAHAGDGNTHPSVFFDAQDEQQTATAEQAFEEIMQIGLDLGGTITSEHGVGYLKKGWLAQELDEGSRWAQRAVKEALDPRGILYPGKMFAGI